MFKATQAVRARQATDELKRYSEDHPNLSTEEMSLKVQSIPERFGISLDEMLVAALEGLAESRAELSTRLVKFGCEYEASSLGRKEPIEEPIDEEPIEAVNDIRGAALEISALRIVKGMAGKTVAEEDECFATVEEEDEYHETVNQIMCKYCPLIELYGDENFPDEWELRAEETLDAIWGEVMKMEEEFQSIT